MVRATVRYDRSDPVNLGSGREITIRDLVRVIADETEFRGRIESDPSTPNRQPRRCPHTSAAERESGFRARTELRTGLRTTIARYEAARRAPVAVG